MSNFDADPLREAFDLGAAEGSAAGVLRATLDGRRLGHMHGAALGGELGFLMGFGAAAPLLDISGAPRAARAASQLVALVQSLGLKQGAPLRPEVDVIATVGRARALGKVLVSTLALPPDFLSSALDPSPSSASASSTAAPLARAASAALDF